MDATLSPAHEALRAEVRALCALFPNAYWRDLDQRREHPGAFVDALTRAGYLAALIPARYGGGGLGVTEASIILEAINRSGGHSAACHAQMYVMTALVRHASEAQRRRWLPPLARGELRLQAFSITEPEAGSDTTAIRTRAVRVGDGWVVHGHKNWTSRVETSDLLLLLARTTPREDLTDRTKGLSLFLVDLRDARAQGALTVEPVRTMFNYETYQVTYDGLRLPADALVGEAGMGFRYAIDGWNAERILLAAEAIGDGRWFVERAVAYANEREVFGRPIGANQGVQFPIAKAYARVVAADAVRWQAAAKYDAGEQCGAEANLAKLLASEASWEAANACLDTFGGNGFVDAYDVERKFRETRLYGVAPVANNLILAYLGQHVLGMPRSY
ncbi:MAG: acyl-CoA/acyl-ACP dehydrogenase [Chloroflexia bacterium]|nr:acyl-CoA/acyl-ACP dehydrogenase [Chloroflexia bacterium]